MGCFAHAGPCEAPLDAGERRCCSCSRRSKRACAGQRRLAQALAARPLCARLAGQGGEQHLQRRREAQVSHAQRPPACRHAILPVARVLAAPGRDVRPQRRCDCARLRAGSGHVGLGGRTSPAQRRARAGATLTRLRGGVAPRQPRRAVCARGARLHHRAAAGREEVRAYDQGLPRGDDTVLAARAAAQPGGRRSLRPPVAPPLRAGGSAAGGEAPRSGPRCREQPAWAARVRHLRGHGTARLQRLPLRALLLRRLVRRVDRPSSAHRRA